MGLYADIHKNYGKFKLDIQFEADMDITGLLGASGSGKSLTLKCIAGLETPDSGVIRLNGRTLFDSAKGINLPPQQRNVGYLFQNYALFPHMTVEQNILCGLHRVKDRTARWAKLQEMCDLFQLHALTRHRPHQLSGGEAQRVALARILAAAPELLLLDEPFSALDSHLREQLQPQTYTLLRQLGIQTLLVTHNQEEAYRMCSALRILHDGCVIRSGETPAVFAQPGSVPAARLTGCKNIAKARCVGTQELEVPQWGIRLRLSRPVPDSVSAVGIYSHSFRIQQKDNGFPVVWTGTIKDPISDIMLFRFPNQSPKSDNLWWRPNKSDLSVDLPEMLYLASEDVLLLTEGE